MGGELALVTLFSKPKSICLQPQWSIKKTGGLWPFNDLLRSSFSTVKEYKYWKLVLD